MEFKFFACKSCDFVGAYHGKVSPGSLRCPVCVRMNGGRAFFVEISIDDFIKLSEKFIKKGDI